MVASRKTKKVFCTVVRVPVSEDRNRSLAERFSTRPSRLLPWADPYIARLVRSLQDEVRSERCTGRPYDNGAQEVRADLDPPSPADTEGGATEETRWNLWDDAYGE